MVMILKILIKSIQRKTCFLKNIIESDILTSEQTENENEFQQAMKTVMDYM
jgi:hypothetical protein